MEGNGWEVFAMPKWLTLEKIIQDKVQPQYRKSLVDRYGDEEGFWWAVQTALEAEDIPKKGGRFVLERICREVREASEGIEPDPTEELVKQAIEEEKEPRPPVVQAVQVEPPSIEVDDPLIQEARKFNFLRAYIDYCGSLTDAPLRYHLLTGLSLLAAAAGNIFRFYTWGVETYPALYVLLIGESGHRKSTCLRRAKDILQEACPERIAPDTFSEEGLITFLSLTPSCLMTIDEMAYLMKTGKKDAYRGTRELITSLYGETFTRRQLAKKSYDIDKPALSLMSSTNTELLAESLTEQDIFGGFLARFIVAVNPPMHESERGDSLALLHVKKSLVDHLRQIASWHLTTVGIAESIDYVEEWRKEFVKNLKGFPRELLPFLPRLDALVYRLATLLRLADAIPGPREELEPKEIEAACLMAGDLTFELLTFLRDEIVSEEAEKIMRRIVYKIALEGGKICRTELIRFAHMKSRTLQPFIDTLVDREELKFPYADEGKEWYELTDDGWKLAKRRLEVV